MCTDGQTDMTKLTVAFRNLTHLTRSHFLSIFSQTQNVSITQVGNFVETRPSAVAVNQADGKQRHKIFAVCFESCIMEIQLNREKQVVYRGKATIYCNYTNFWVCVIIIVVVFTFMHSIYNYMPKTNRVYIVHSVAAVLYLQSVLHVMLFRTCNMFCTFTSALSAVCVHCTIWLFFVVP